MNKEITIDLEQIPEEDLLKMRMCDLGLKIAGTDLETCVTRLYSELEDKGLRLRPLCYLGDEWFSPDGIPAIAIPFYLAHPRLKTLEQKMMLEVEGNGETECMKLLRHECGHAVVHAFNLLRRPKWREIFGEPDKSYDDYYRFRPYSKKYVQHLKNWYAQSHPEEDFAETFAIWLDPHSCWREFYRNWPALKKLEYVDKLMKSLRERDVKAYKKDCSFRVEKLKRKLQDHYDKRKKNYAQDEEKYFDNDLLKMFKIDINAKRSENAATFLRQNRTVILNAVSRWTRERKFFIKQLLGKLSKRCLYLKLVLDSNEKDTLIQFIAYITAISSHHRYTSRYKGKA